MKKYLSLHIMTLFIFVLEIITILALILTMKFCPKDNIYAYVFMVCFVSLFVIGVGYVLILSFQITIIDEEKIVQINPLRSKLTIYWKDIVDIEIIKVVLTSIYIADVKMTTGEKISLSPYKRGNHIIRVLYSKKILTHILKYYNKDIQSNRIKIF